MRHNANDCRCSRTIQGIKEDTNGSLVLIVGVGRNQKEIIISRRKRILFSPSGKLPCGYISCERGIPIVVIESCCFNLHWGDYAALLVASPINSETPKSDQAIQLCLGRIPSSWTVRKQNELISKIREMLIDQGATVVIDE